MRTRWTQLRHVTHVTIGTAIVKSIHALDLVVASICLSHYILPNRSIFCLLDSESPDLLLLDSNSHYLHYDSSPSLTCYSSSSSSFYLGFLPLASAISTYWFYLLPVLFLCYRFQTILNIIFPIPEFLPNALLHFRLPGLQVRLCIPLYC